ncbi:thiol:disulfide interchange protein DsbA/DsbL [Halomonas sp. CnH100-B]|jgi:thiol:disulfide interchange protein DsbA|uniref:Thiol:disulfide interchange protein n=1 Tax=Vreelandella aquamarina TaxID=77097 RepID=A0A857GPR3_9GAMM|nr:MULTISPECIES: thiol:disulfide interchange protein DsbA/DsbL [Halomonas]MAO63276.1 disulfide bond formation protein DsbA [Halomonas sp.]MCO7229823.1 thiol:disulfide interchange protein DsbA/DsbL [Halomonas sp. CnH100-B]MDK9688268.1 thiol:disulfide interchange protein DsbA/DsbL [Halomonas sp. LC1]MDP4557666.1 thiol:disulfide interchange protein DsbA/DsbL [Halomonas meridiana]QHD51328.1 disulfide bond formation protein DsbA [Halomonas meridiana]|tara:strand:- start:933 stop:1565 length:633 start_codon:yes stop_codon:yes gene_type:complete
MLKTLMVALAGLGLSAAVSAQELVEGQHYTLLESPVATQVDDDQIEVTEAFWFGCPHCYRLQTSVNEWYETLDDDVSIVKMPATMGGDWNTHATAFYAAQSLGIEEELHQDFFDAIHQDGRSLTEADDIAEFFSDYGVSEEEAEKALTAFSVRSEVNKANSRMRDMRLMGVPALIVDGRYVVSPQSAGSLENMPQIADALIEKVRSERAQ